MDCFVCKGDFDDKNTTFMVDLGNCVIIIKDVPSQVCRQCGEVTYDNQTTKEIEIIANKMKNISTEITVVSFRSNVA